MSRAIDALYSGQRIGKLVITTRTTKTQYGRRSTAWEATCDCGRSYTAVANDLVRNRVSSCGCARAKHVATPTRRHGLKGKNPHPLYVTWHNMIQRCHTPSNKRFASYGARGIYVCDRWRFGEDGVTGLECFIRDMGDRPSGMTIDRIDNKGSYEPGNCRWATAQEQMRNRSVAVDTDEVARLMSEGLTGAQISAAMGRHRNSIYSAMKRIRAAAQQGDVQ